ncbi:hypothetical protein [Actinoplanes sp. NPDC049316]|uniref:hypothetical protein n=1 Tax=Actinoplanes sp. NPDC049316 TaxID=3154727 RepID=UPI0034297C77
MGTQDDKPNVTHANAQDMLRALKTERAGYEQRGLTDRVKAVDEQIAHWTKVAKDAPVNPDDAGEVRASDEAINAEKMLTALREEKAGLEGREGKEKRVSAIDEQIKHWTGVLRKAKQAAGPNGATPAAAAGQQQRA